VSAPAALFSELNDGVVLVEAQDQRMHWHE